jgi:hypothetical protein
VVRSKAGAGQFRVGLAFLATDLSPTGLIIPYPLYSLKVVNPSGIQVEQGGLRGWVGQVGWSSWK